LLPVGIFATDARGAVVWANHRADELLGSEPTRPGGDPDRRLLAARSLGLVGPLSRVLATGQAIAGVDIIVERRAGARSFATASIQPLKTDDGRVAGAVACLEDTTALYDAEARLTSLEVELARLSATHTDAAA